MKDIKRNGTQSERELTGRGGVAAASLREINISWAFFFFSFLCLINTPACFRGIPLSVPRIQAAAQQNITLEKYCTN